MKRREFIILSSVGATSASLLSACGHPEEKLIPAFIPDEEFVPGIDYWKASTCGMCPAGCGIIVRTREHKANKIEGNPLHPVNRGALCARGQAGLEVLYNPDRIKGPMKRVGERGEGKWEEISWDEGIKILAGKLREIEPNSTSQKAQFITGDADGVTAYVAGRFMQAYRQAFVVARPDIGIDLPGMYTDSMRGVVIPGEPVFDIANATYLLSFGARFLETWKSPVMYSQAYGEFRGSHGKTRGRFVHVEPRMSLTAANADEWIAPAPGTEALVALAMIQVIVREGLNKVSVSADSTRTLDAFAPEQVSTTCDVPVQRIINLAREFAKAERPMAIEDLGRTADAVHLLNTIVANLNKPGGVRIIASGFKSKKPLDVPSLILPGESDEQIKNPNDSIERISRFFQTSQVPNTIMLIHGFNPLMASLGRKEFLNAQFVVSFSSFMDETSEMADLILPDHTFLECWDVHISYGPDGKRVVSLTQPVLEAQLNTRQTADVLLAVAREMGSEVGAALPYESAKEVVEKNSADFLTSERGPSAEPAWSELAEKGLVQIGSPTSDEQPTAKDEPISLNTFSTNLVWPFAGSKDNGEYPFTLLVYEHGVLGDGSAANLPSIQELPDPLTSVIWGSWVEINPKIASELGITDGDVVELTTGKGSVRAPALVYPGIRPDCLATPSGQGHSSYGRYARGRGANFREELLGVGEKTARAKLTKVGGRAQLIRFGTELMEHMESKR